MALWTIAAAGVTVFKIVTDSAKETLRPLYGALFGILVSDRAKALNFWVMAQRQIFGRIRSGSSSRFRSAQD